MTAPCGRRTCARRALHRDYAAAATLVGAAAVLLGPPAARIASGPATVLAAVAWIALALYRCRCDGDALDGILADPPLPREWTRADWAELRELERQPCRNQNEED